MYLIDHARHVVHSRAWGILSSDDVRELSQRLMADPSLKSGFRALTDLSHVTEVRVDAASLEEMAEMPLFDPEARRAIIAPNEAAYDVAAMFAALATRLGNQVRVFRDRTSAEEWLEL
jgi:hypothetical protein